MAIFISPYASTLWRTFFGMIIAKITLANRDAISELNIKELLEKGKPNYRGVESPSCESLGNPKETIEQVEPRQCKDLAKEGFRLVQRKIGHY